MEQNQAAVIQNYVNRLATATQQNVMLEVENEQLKAEIAQLRAGQPEQPVEGNVVN